MALAGQAGQRHRLMGENHARPILPDSRFGREVLASGQFDLYSVCKTKPGCFHGRVIAQCHCSGASDLAKFDCKGMDFDSRANQEIETKTMGYECFGAVKHMCACGLSC